MGVPHRTVIYWLLPLLLIVLIWTPTQARLIEPTEGAGEAVNAFGQALTSGKSSALKRWFPDDGKIRVRLVQFGDEQGALRSGQLLVILQAFFERGAVDRFKIETIEEADTIAIVIAIVQLRTTHGTRESVRLHLSFQRNGDRWVVREFREARPSK
jgi:hypothetical protein